MIILSVFWTDLITGLRVCACLSVYTAYIWNSGSDISLYFWMHGKLGTMFFPLNFWLLEGNFSGEIFSNPAGNFTFLLFFSLTKIFSLYPRGAFFLPPDKFFLLRCFFWFFCINLISLLGKNLKVLKNTQINQSGILHHFLLRNLVPKFVLSGK